MKKVERNCPTNIPTKTIDMANDTFLGELVMTLVIIIGVSEEVGSPRRNIKHKN